jgi:hypothetical protein
VEELKNNAGRDILNEFDKDVDAGKIELIQDDYLREIGMYYVFAEHYRIHISGLVTAANDMQ